MLAFKITWSNNENEKWDIFTQFKFKYRICSYYALIRITYPFCRYMHRKKRRKIFEACHSIFLETIFSAFEKELKIFRIYRVIFQTILVFIELWIVLEIFSQKTEIFDDILKENLEPRQNCCPGHITLKLLSAKILECYAFRNFALIVIAAKQN